MRVRVRARNGQTSGQEIVDGNWRKSTAPLRRKLQYLYETNTLVDVIFHLYSPVSTARISRPVSRTNGHGPPSPSISVCGPPSPSISVRGPPSPSFLAPGYFNKTQQQLRRTPSPSAPRSTTGLNGSGHGHNGVVDRRNSAADSISDTTDSSSSGEETTDSSETDSDTSESSESSEEEVLPDLIVKAHRLVLGMASPVFARSLYETTALHNSIVEVHDWCPAVFKNMIDFMYTGECRVETVETARDIFRIAKAHQCQSLVTYITKFVSSAVKNYRFTPRTCGNLFFFLEFAREIRDAEMERLCWSYLDRHAARIVTTSDFLALGRDMVTTLLRRETFDIGDELVVFLTVKRWGEQRVRESPNVGGSLRDRVIELLPLIRLERISETDFIRTVLPSGLMGPQELVSFFMIRGIRIPRNLDLTDSSAACRTLLASHIQRSTLKSCLHYRTGFKLSRQHMDDSHELRFQADRDIQLAGVCLGYIFSRLELGVTVRVQGPFERVQWTDMFSQYCRVSGDTNDTQPADMRVVFREPVHIHGRQCYKITAKVDRWKYTPEDFNIWGGQGGPCRARTDCGVVFYFLQAAVEKGRDIPFADMDKCRGLITELLFTVH